MLFHESPMAESKKSVSGDGEDHFEVAPKAVKLYYQYTFVEPANIMGQKYTSIASAFPVKAP